MPTQIRNRYAVPLTLPFPFRGILPPGGVTTVDMSESEVLDSLGAIGGSSSPVALTSVQGNSNVDLFAQGNAVNGPVLNLFELLIADPTLPNEVAVANLSGFPSPDGGVIQLADNTDYRILSAINIGTDTLRFGTNTIMNGRSSLVDKIIYTGTGTAIEIPASASLAAIQHLAVTATTGLALDVQGPAAVTLRNMQVTAKNLGNLRATFTMAISDLTATGFETGFLFSGANGTLLISSAAFVQGVGGSGNVVLDLGSATFNVFGITNVLLATASGGVALSGVAASANINVGGHASIVHSNFDGAGASLSEVTTNDLRWRFIDVIGVPDSVVLGSFTQSGSEETTAVDGETKLSLTTAPQHERRIEHTTSNQLTYRELEPQETVVDMCLLVDRSGGSDFDADFGVAVNGTIVASLDGIGVTNKRQVVACSFVLNGTLTTDDEIELFARTATAKTVRVNGARLAVRTA